MSSIFRERSIFSTLKSRANFISELKLRCFLNARRQRQKNQTDRNMTLAGTGKRGNQHHSNFLKTWWQMSYPRAGLMGQLATLPRYIVCGQVTKWPTSSTSFRHR